MNRKIDHRHTKQVVIHETYHKELKKAAAEAGVSIREFLEGHLADILAPDRRNNNVVG